MSNSLNCEELYQLDAYWRAANYLSVGQIYLLDNPLLHEPLLKEHIKPRLLGHWGTTPGLNFLYVHLNRVIRKHDLSMIYITGPGHEGPGLVASTYLEGTYTEHFPSITQNEAGMQRLLKQFSISGGIPSHIAPKTGALATSRNSTKFLNVTYRSMLSLGVWIRREPPQPRQGQVHEL